MAATRTSDQHHATKETTITLSLTLDGRGDATASTGIPFFDHMLEQLGKHGGFDLSIEATGDLEIDLHHTVEDVGIVLGTALKDALGDKAGVRRFANALVPLDEALVQVALDLSGRPYLVYDVDPVAEWIGTFDPQLCEEFWRAFVFASGITLHLRSLSGRNGHHVIEASFKGVARALRDAVLVEGDGIPSTKGALESRRTVLEAVMELFPAIDLRAGRCVRLEQGDFAAETVYGEDPVGVARGFAAAGAPWIHVVDLDAARTGEPANLSVIEKIAAAVPCALQVGGGVRTQEAADALLLAGATRVVVGTAAVEHPELVDALCLRHPDRIAVGLDARGVEVAVRGWTEGSGVDLVDVAVRFERSGIAALIVTEIGRDGMMVGPDVEQLASVLAVTPIPVVASGGVGDLADLLALSALEVGGRELAGAIVGRAIYEGRFTVSEALEALAL